MTVKIPSVRESAEIRYNALKKEANERPMSEAEKFFNKEYNTLNLQEKEYAKSVGRDIENLRHSYIVDRDIPRSLYVQRTQKLILDLPEKLRQPYADLTPKLWPNPKVSEWAV